MDFRILKIENADFLILLSFVLVIASKGAPNLSEVLVLTSIKHSIEPSSAIISISPYLEKR